MAANQHINFHYRRSSSFARFQPSGVIGSVNPQGQVVAHFYFEFATLPEEEIATITETGQLDWQRPETDTPSFDREILGAAVMAPHVAKAIGTWLIEKAEQAEKTAIGTSSSTPS